MSDLWVLLGGAGVLGALLALLVRATARLGRVEARVLTLETTVAVHGAEQLHIRRQLAHLVKRQETQTEIMGEIRREMAELRTGVQIADKVSQLVTPAIAQAVLTALTARGDQITIEAGAQTGGSRFSGPTRVRGPVAGGQIDVGPTGDGEP